MSWSPAFDNPELTFSAQRILRSMIDEGIGGTGKAFGEAYRILLREEPLEILQEEEFIAERDASVRRQQEIERRMIPSRLPRGLRARLTQRKGHSRVARISSLKTDDDISSASFIYSDSPRNKVQFILKNYRGGD